MRLGLAFRLFFRVLSDADFARRVAAESAAAPQEPSPRVGGAAPAPTGKTTAAAPRSDAVTLLATLQREARLVDIVYEPLEGYGDAQIGAAARDVLRDCRQVLDRLFALRPLVDQAEGGAVEVPAGYDAGRYRLTGNVSRQPPLSGQLVHAGWQATRCELPAWTGSREAALVVAPAEVEA